jgi:hypothetical protein
MLESIGMRFEIMPHVAAAILCCGACNSDTIPVREVDKLPPRFIAEGSLKPSLSPGTLLLTSHFAWAANPDGDVVDVVDVESKSVVWTAQLPEGSSPGRLWEAPDAKMWVVLRGAAGVAVLDRTERTIEVHDVCAAPRGIAGLNDTVLVACATGELVTLARDGHFMSARMLGRDLRDVVVGPDGTIYVSRFRSASLITLGGRGGELVRELQPPEANFSTSEGGTNPSSMLPHVAWRTILGPGGDVYMLHQYATTRALETVRPSMSSPSPYGGQGSCPSSPVATAVTRYVGGQPFSTTILPDTAGVDIAASSSDIVVVGGADRSITQLSTRFFSSTGASCTFGATISKLDRPVVAVGISADVFFQTRDDARLVAYSKWPLGSTDVTIPDADVDVALSPSVPNKGFEIFHTPTPAGIACTSCHPEGGDDGHVWTLIESGEKVLRRTPSLRGGILPTSPFHWDGKETDFGVLMKDVFVGRMGGTATAADIYAVGQWVDAIPKLPPPAWLDRLSIDRGTVLFNGKAGCSSCHSGPHFTNNQTMDVGTGGAFQVPSLINVAARTPLMHDGCAKTLHDRLTNPSCAGVKHGNTSVLSDGERADLETYLESL